MFNPLNLVPDLNHGVICPLNLQTHFISVPTKDSKKSNRERLCII